MQKKGITLVAVAVVLILVTVLNSGFSHDTVFTDVPKNAWEAPYVYDLVERGIVSGYGDGTFGPNEPVQRCEYAKMLVGISNTPISTSVSTPYTDVPDWEWYFPYVNSSLSYITGFTRNGELCFAPEENATREDVAVALVKALKLNVSAYGDPAGFLQERFTDVNTISAHNLPYIAAAVDKGYITGDTEGTFRGQDTIIRAEVVAVLCRAFPEGTPKKESNAVKKPLTAFFLDVGQGDACYLEFPDGKTMLIDAGTGGAKEDILNFLQKRGCKKLDYVIATHPHADHIGSMTAVLREYPVGTFYMPRAETNTKTFETMLETLLEKKIPVTAATAGESIDGIENVTAVFTAPVNDAEDLNNASAVLRLSYGETDFLFTGDAEEGSESLMVPAGLPLDAEILKVGHHGSDTSSSAKFLAVVQPDIAVISCGEGNSYGHPHEEALTRLTNIGAAIYRTDEQGTVTVTTDGEEIQVSTER